jgi:hypothetical protein
LKIVEHILVDILIPTIGDKIQNTHVGLTSKTWNHVVFYVSNILRNMHRFSLKSKYCTKDIFSQLYNSKITNQYGKIRFSYNMEGSHQKYNKNQ